MTRGLRRMPAASYLCRPVGSAAVAFVPDPKHAGRWIKTTPAALFVKCPRCGAQPGQACMGRTEHTGSHHFARSYKFSLIKTLGIKTPRRTEVVLTVLVDRG